jgi:hypothetical protein
VCGDEGERDWNTAFRSRSTVTVIRDPAASAGRSSRGFWAVQDSPGRRAARVCFVHAEPTGADAGPGRAPPSLRHTAEPDPRRTIGALGWTREGTALTLTERHRTLRKEPRTASRRLQAAVAVLPTWVAGSGPRRIRERPSPDVVPLHGRAVAIGPVVVWVERRNFSMSRTSTLLAAREAKPSPRSPLV